MIKYYTKLVLLALQLFLFKNNSAQFFSGQINPNWIVYYDEANAQNIFQYNFNYKELVVAEHGRSKRYIYNYDTEGRLVTYLEEKKKNSTKSKGFLIEYMTPGKKLKKKVSYFKNNSVFKTSGFDYNACDKITSYILFDKDMILKYKDIYVYDSSLILLHEGLSYKHTVPNLKTKEVYEYEPDKQLKKITYYNNKNKVYRKTVFDCNPIGVNRKISKDSVYTCVKYDTDSLGNRLKIIIENIKNRSTKVVQYFNKNNKLIAYKYFDLKKDQPTYYVFYNTETGVPLKYIFFNKGKETYRSESKFDAKNNIIETIMYYKNKVASTFKNEYNSDGLLIAGKTFNSKNKQIKSIAYAYELK